MTASEVREQQKQLKALCQHVIAHLAAMDVEMTKPSTEQRGKRIAKLCGDLELANDIALRYGLGLERRGIKLRKIAKAQTVKTKKSAAKGKTSR